MSYDIAILATDALPSSDASAWPLLEAQLQQEGEAPQIFRQAYDRIVERYPCISTLSDAETESGVWSSGPLWSGFGPNVASLSIQFPHAEAVVPFVVETARSLGLTVFDWQTKLVHRADGIKGLELTSEDAAIHKLPTMQQIWDAAAALTPDGGPAFLILERAGRDYLQVAGGKGAYACEWRMYNGDSPRFSHCVLGLYNVATTADIQIPTNGFHVTVKENERLALSDVRSLLGSFADDDDPPADYRYRDITERFV